jgi:hypothetical protein
MHQNRHIFNAPEQTYIQCARTNNNRHIFNAPELTITDIYSMRQNHQSPEQMQKKNVAQRVTGT